MSPYVFKVKGMHCPACEQLVKDVLSDGQVGVEPSLSHSCVTVTGLTTSAQDWKTEGNKKLSPLGYRLYLQEEDPRKEEGKETLWALLAGGLFLGLFALVQASGVVSLFSPDKLELPGSFLLGVLASFSSCFALVGGLLVTFAASVGRSHPRTLGPALGTFHLARLATFFVLGGVLGQVGEVLAINSLVMNLLLTFAALVMTLLGLNLLGAFRWSFSWRTTMAKPPQNQKQSTAGALAGGFLLGASTFFLPCGFTQTVQFQALAGGGFLEGGSLTLVFALGTFPVLFLVGWGLTKGLAGRSRAILLKASGVVVLGLGLFQLWGAANLWGLAKILSFRPAG